MTDSVVNDLVASWSEAELGVPGRVLPVVRAPAVVLSSAGDTVDPVAAETVQLAADLVATMRVSPGCVGLAAPQLGAAASVFCVDVSQHPKTKDHHGTFVLCNAEVVEATRNEKAREGCLSVPDFTGDVKRATRLVVQGRLPGTGREVQAHRERLRGPRAPARDRPLRRTALPRPGCRRARDPPPQDLLMTGGRRRPDRPRIPTGRGSRLKSDTSLGSSPSGGTTSSAEQDPPLAR